MKVDYAIESHLAAEEFLGLLRRSKLAERRPIDEPLTIAGMLREASVIATARRQSELIGVARAISDRAYCTYLSDLAVDQQYQRQGIGKRLIELTHRAAGLGTTLVLLAAPAARSYYAHIGLQPHSSCWIIPRQPQSERVGTGEPSETAAGRSPAAAEPSCGVGEFFDSLAADYEQAITRCFPRYGEMLWALMDYLPDLKTEEPKILELGCGTGNLSMRIAERFPRAKLTFLDISPSSLELCKSRLPRGVSGTWTCGDMRNAEFQPHSFDYVLSSIAIHHLSTAEKQALFANVRRWLRPGGMFCYSDQFSAATSAAYARHLDNWKRSSMQAGSTVSEWECWMEHQLLHDHHDSLPDQMKWLQVAGFDQIDCPWRFLLWTVVQARKPPLAAARP